MHTKRHWLTDRRAEQTCNCQQCTQSTQREREREGQSHTLKLSQFLCSIVPCVDGGSLTVTDNFCIATTTVATLASFFCCLPHVHECLSLCKAVPLTMVVLVAASATPAPFHSNPLSPPCHPASFSADSQHNELQRHTRARSRRS